MPLGELSRRFLVASYVHLGVAGGLLAAAPWDGALTVHWDVLLWILLIGFAGFTTMGFALHLYPGFSQRPAPVVLNGLLGIGLAESSVVLGALALWGGPVPDVPGWTLTLAAILYGGVITGLLVGFVSAARMVRLGTRSVSVRPADAFVVPLFLGSWFGALAASALFAMSGISGGPGFGWWIAGVHSFVLGHLVLLILAASLRLVPRSLTADPPTAWAGIASGAASLGAVTVPLGMLLSDPNASTALVWFALPEAAAAGSFLVLLGVLAVRARTPRPQILLHALGFALLCVGGSIGLWMVAREDYGLVASHAFVNLFGFVGLTVLVMSFGMLSPYQRISHVWTTRMLWILAGSWMSALALVVALGRLDPTSIAGLFATLGAVTAAVAVLWGLGAVPVLYPALRPLLRPDQELTASK